MIENESKDSGGMIRRESFLFGFQDIGDAIYGIQGHAILIDVFAE